METTDQQQAPQTASFSRPQDKSPSFHPRTSAFFPNNTALSNLSPLTGLLSQSKKTETTAAIPLLDDMHDLPLKKTKSENAAVTLNMLSRIDPKPQHVENGESDLIKQLSGSNSENTVKEELTKIEGGIKLEEERASPQFVPIQMPTQAKIDQQEAYRLMFSALVREFENYCKQQLTGLQELEKWYNTDVPFSPPIPESIHGLLLERMSRKVKVDREAGNIITKVLKVFEINNEYREKTKEYLQSKGIHVNGAAQNDKKVDKTKVIVLDGNYDASNSKIGNKRTFQELEALDKGKEHQEQV